MVLKMVSEIGHHSGNGTFSLGSIAKFFCQLEWILFNSLVSFFQYSIWNVLWIGWNTFIICFYLNIGILDRVSIERLSSNKTLGSSFGNVKNDRLFPLIYCVFTIRSVCDKSENLKRM